MKKLIILTASIACAAVHGNHARAETNSALGCLQASAQSGGLSNCLNESGQGGSTPVWAANTRIVPTPTGWTNAEDGTLKAGFYNGLDSGFKTAFMAIEYLPILGMESSGAPNQINAGTIACMAVGILLSIPAAVIGAVLGAPVGAAAGMIAETASPGSTDDWFSF